MERTNSISGRKYRDDATIFAWDLVNEPRCETWRVSIKHLQLQHSCRSICCAFTLANASGVTGEPLPRRCRSAKKRCPPGSTRWRPS